MHGAVAALCLLLAALAVVHTSGAIPDDALITYRYAQNLLNGHGWVYDLHRPTTDAATAPLYTVLLVIGGFVVGSVTRAGTALFVLTTAAAGYLAFALLRRHGMSMGGVVAACLLILNPWLLATRGMETSLFVALLLLASLLLSMQRLIAAGAVLAAATFVRGDGAVVLVVAFVFLLVQARRVPWRFVLGAAAAAVPWSIFATVVIGSPIPDTLGAKAAQGKSGLWGTGYVFVHGVTAIPQAFKFSDWAVALLVVSVMGVPLAFVDRGLRGSVGPLIVGAVLIFGVYGFVIKTPNYHWYYGTQVAALALCGGVEPAADQLAGQLSVSGSDVASHQALASLVALYATTPSLQSAYTHGGRLDLPGILAWAGGSGPSTVSYGAAVERDAATYQALAKAASAASGRAGGSGSVVAPLPMISFTG